MHGTAQRVRRTREENGRRVREALLRAGVRVVARHGFAGASVQRITEACDVSQGTLYTYFDSLQQLLDELLPAEGLLMLHALGRAGGATDGYFEQERLTFDALVAYLRRKPYFLRLLTEAETAAPRSHDQHYRNIEARYLRALQRGRERGELRPQADAAFKTVAGMLSAARGYIVIGFCPRDSKRLFHPPPLPAWATDTYVKFARRGVGATTAIPARRPARRRSAAAAPTDTRLRILEAAARTIGTKGCAAARVADICTAAGVAVGTFYGHFPGRDEMLDAVLAHAREALAADVTEATLTSGSFIEYEARSFDAFFRHVQRNPWFPRLEAEGAVWAPSAYLMHFHALSDAYVAAMKHYRTGAELRAFDDHELPLLAHMFMAARHDLAMRTLLAGDPPLHLPDAVRTAYLDLVARGLEASS